LGTLIMKVSLRNMRTVISFAVITMVLMAGGCDKKQADKTESGNLSGTITLSGAWALYPMAVKWGEEFGKIHPDVKIDIAAGGAGKGMADCLSGVVDIGMVSREIYPAEQQKGAWWVAVTKDAVVPTVNRNNPILQELLVKGLKRETFIGIWLTGEVKSWGQTTGVDTAGQIHVYTRSDACGAAETWAKFLGGNQEDLEGIGVYGDPGLAEAVGRDELGIGFNNINYAYDSKSKMQVQGIRVLPIDFNGNGKIDADENFYSDRDAIVGAIASGKFPSPPARDLHFVCGGAPKREVVREFIKWVLSDGQKFVDESGYIRLSDEKTGEAIKKLEGSR
jgi:phosphate transport system substrate-binding protein